MTNTYPRVLTIAGSDSGGGAGIQADIKTVTALGGYASSVLTCLTAQNTLGVQALLSLPKKFIRQQLESVLSDIGSDSIKIGLLGNKETLLEVAQVLTEYFSQAGSKAPVVIDPVMVATSGDLLLEKSAIRDFKKTLLPLADLLTPNLYEAEVLSEIKINSQEDIYKACHVIHRAGAKNILIKGGHRQDHLAIDTLFLASTNKFYNFSHPKISTKNTHGTGCTLSSAIATYLAKNWSLLESVKRGKDFVSSALTAGTNYELGKGCGPINHLFLSGRQ